jgi:predicted nucleic acid-binding protein
VSIVLDTNTVIYLLGGRLVEPFPGGGYAISIITEIELLSYPALSFDDERRINSLLATVTIVEITPAVRDAAIRLRRDHRLRVPDAVIAGTAIALDAELMTNDARLARIPELRCQQPPFRNQ